MKEWGKEKLLNRQSYCKKMSFKLAKGSQAQNLMIILLYTFVCILRLWLMLQFNELDCFMVILDFVPM